MTTTTTPASSRQQLPSEADSGGLGWDTKTMIIGTALGAALGLATSWLLIRSSRDTRGGPPQISSTDALKVGVTTIGLMRAIAALGDN